MKLRWSRHYNTITLSYGRYGYLVGLRGRELPSLQWHWLVYIWRPVQDWARRWLHRR